MNTRSRPNDRSSSEREPVAQRAAPTRARGPHARRVILEPDRRRPGCRHVHPDTPRGRPAGDGVAREASPRGRSRGHAASSAGGPRVRGARGGGSAHGDADLAELAGTRLARDLRCSQRRRATADRCDRDAHTRPDPCRRADIERQRRSWSDALRFERFVPALDLPVRLRVKRRGSDVRHARDSNELLEVLGDELGPLTATMSASSIMNVSRR